MIGGGVTVRRVGTDSRPRGQPQSFAGRLSDTVSESTLRFRGVGLVEGVAVIVAAGPLVFRHRSVA